MNEDDLVNLSEANINGKRKLMSLFRMANMLRMPETSNVEMEEEIEEMIQVLSKEIEIHDRLHPPPTPPKPFDISEWIEDE